MPQTSRRQAYLAEATGLLQSGAWARSNTSRSLDKAIQPKLGGILHRMSAYCSSLQQHDS